MTEIAAVDMFVVATATLKLLYAVIASLVSPAANKPVAWRRHHKCSARRRWL